MTSRITFPRSADSSTSERHVLRVFRPQGTPQASRKGSNEAERKETEEKATITMVEWDAAAEERKAMNRSVGSIAKNPRDSSRSLALCIKAQ